MNSALEYAKGLNFFSKKLLIYLICDAPCHGNAYTSTNRHKRDDISKIRPENEIENIMFHFRTLPDKDVDFIAFKIKPKMTEKLFLKM